VLDLVVGFFQRAALQVGALLVIGAAVWMAVIEPAVRRGRAPAASASLPHRWVGRVATLAVALLIPVWALRLHVQLAGFRDPFVPVRDDLEFLVRETFWGTVWIAQGALLLTLLVLLLVTGRGVSPEGASAPRRYGLVAGALLLALTLGLSSHALSVEEGRGLATAAHTLHTLAAGAWMGSLFLILTARSAASSSDTLADQLRVFSPVAMVSVAVLVGMGVYLSFQYLSSVEEIWTSTYGRVLAAKVLTAGAVLLMGLVNWRAGMPDIDSPAVAAAVRRRATVEVGAALVVLLLTAILTATPRPGE
jgi:putative copper export protein